MVSSLILSRVLLSQIGQCIHSNFILPIPRCCFGTIDYFSYIIASHIFTKLFSILNHSRSCENCGDGDDVIINFRKNLAIHLAHELSANVKPQPVANNVSCICSAPKALENMRQIVLAECTAAIPDCNLDAFVIFWENQFHTSAIAVFEGIDS